MYAFYMHQGANNTNHHYRVCSSRDKYYEDSTPRGNHGKKMQNRYVEARSKVPYIEKFNIPTPPLMSERRSRRQMKVQISLIADDAISIGMSVRCWFGEKHCSAPIISH